MKDPEGILLDVHGVGYDVSVPLSTLAALPPVGQEASLWIYTRVREDELRLFGFGSQKDKEAFTTMLKVNGVGPKVAIAVIGALTSSQLAKAINDSDTKRLTAIPGIGKKTAERIILELGGKLTITDEPGQKPILPLFSQVKSALVNLGFKAAQVDKVVTSLEKETAGEGQFEDLLRKSLALLQGNN